MHEQHTIQFGRFSDRSRGAVGPWRGLWALLGGFAVAVTLFAMSYGVDIPEASDDWRGKVPLRDYLSDGR